MGSSTITPPASAPAAASTPAPTTPAVSTPTPAPATPPEITPGDSVTIESKLGEAWKKVAAEPIAEEVAETPAETPEATVEAPAAEVAAPETSETPAETPEATTETPETPETPETAQPEFVLDDGQAADPAALAAELKNDPAAQKFFDDRPDLKGKVFGALRRDAENRAIRQYIPNLETAKTVTKDAGTFRRIDNTFLKAGDSPEGARAFINEWVKEAMITDDKGQPVIGEDGKYKVHPALFKVFDHISDNKISVAAGMIEKSGKLPAFFSPAIDALHKFATTSGDERLQAAADILKEVIQTPPSSALGEVPENLKAYADSLKADREALNKDKAAAERQRSESQEATHRQSIVRAETKAVESVRAQLKPLFTKAGLKDFEQKAATREIGELIEEKLGSINPDGSWTGGSHESAALFQSIYDSILLQPPSEAREKQLTRHILTYSNEILGPIASQVIREAKGGALSRQTATATKVAAQTAASRTEPKGTSITTSPAAVQSPAQARAAFEKSYMEAHNGDKPSIEEWLDHARKLVSPARK